MRNIARPVLQRAKPRVPSAQDEPALRRIQAGNVLGTERRRLGRRHERFGGLSVRKRRVRVAIGTVSARCRRRRRRRRVRR